MGTKPVIVNWWNFLQGLTGSLLGFFFTKPVLDGLLDFFAGGSESLPTQIPMLTQLFAYGGTVGIIIILIIILLAIKLFKRLATFVTWLILGVLAAILINLFGLHPLDLISNFIGMI